MRSLRVLRDGVAAHMLWARQRFRFRAVADPNKVIWVDPRSIRWSLSSEVTASFRVLGTIADGDWDFHVQELERTRKFIGLRQHFAEGIPWEETELFSGYQRRLEREGSVLGCSSIDALVDYYEAHVDGLYGAMKKRGFVMPTGKTVRRDWVCVHIGRDGDILLGRDGNHRVAIARMCDVKSIPVKVLVRHLEWQVRREEALRAFDAPGDPSAEGLHPDLLDVAF